MSKRKLNIRCDRVYLAMVIEKRRSWRHKLVYVLRADSRVKHYKGKSEKNDYERKYRKRGSRIIYIGQTSVGQAKMVRPSYSAVRKGEKAFREIVGIRRVEVYLVTATRLGRPSNTFPQPG